MLLYRLYCHYCIQSNINAIALACHLHIYNSSNYVLNHGPHLNSNSGSIQIELQLEHFGINEMLGQMHFVQTLLRESRIESVYNVIALTCHLHIYNSNSF